MLRSLLFVKNLDDIISFLLLSVDSSSSEKVGLDVKGRLFYCHDDGYNIF